MAHGALRVDQQARCDRCASDAGPHRSEQCLAQRAELGTRVQNGHGRDRQTRTVPGRRALGLGQRGVELGQEQAAAARGEELARAFAVLGRLIGSGAGGKVAIEFELTAPDAGAEAEGAGGNVGLRRAAGMRQLHVYMHLNPRPRIVLSASGKRKQASCAYDWPA